MNWSITSNEGTRNKPVFYSLTDLIAKESFLREGALPTTQEEDTLSTSGIRSRFRSC